MTTFLLRRLLIALPTLLAVIIITFTLMRLTPGSPFSGERKLDPATEARLNQRFNLDGTLSQQLTRYLLNLARGDLGDSTHFRNRSVREIIAQTLPRSMVIGAGALTLALALGIGLGTFAAVHHHGWQDRLAMTLALVGICLPAFLLAPLAILLFAIVFPIFPVAGWGTASHLLLPILCLSLPYAAYCARLMRTSMLEILGQDFIRTARAKGLDEQKVIYKHALKLAILPLISYAGPLAANILTGSLVIEEIFKIPGVGAFFVNGVLNRDVFLVGGIVIVYSALLILMNILADVLLATLDRRVRLW